MVVGMSGFQWQDREAHGKAWTRYLNMYASPVFIPGIVSVAPCNSTKHLRASVSLNITKRIESRISSPSLSARKCYRSNILCRQDLKFYNIIWGMFGVPTSLTVALRLCLCKLKRRHEAIIIQQNPGKGDSFNLNCLHQYPSRGNRSTPHLTM